MRHTDEAARTGLVGLASPDVHDKTGRVGLELAAAQGGAERQQQQRPVPHFGQPLAGAGR